jgi:hypothetical protein
MCDMLHMRPGIGKHDNRPASGRRRRAVVGNGPRGAASGVREGWRRAIVHAQGPRRRGNATGPLASMRSAQRALRMPSQRTRIMHRFAVTARKHPRRFRARTAHPAMAGHEAGDAHQDRTEARSVGVPPYGFAFAPSRAIDNAVSIPIGRAASVGPMPAGRSAARTASAGSYTAERQKAAPPYLSALHALLLFLTG